MAIKLGLKFVSCFYSIYTYKKEKFKGKDNKQKISPWTIFRFHQTQINRHEETTSRIFVPLSIAYKEIIPLLDGWQIRFCWPIWILVDWRILNIPRRRSNREMLDIIRSQIMRHFPEITIFRNIGIYLFIRTQI